MVFPALGAAAAAAGTAGSAGATAMGLKMGKTDLDLTRELFKLQMRQAKRLWTADWSEQAIRHGEACMQSAQQHAEAQAMATAAYFQAEKLATQSVKLARDQDSRNFEIAWRTEIRESLRDELTNQNNRFNIIMLCDTVCLSCVFGLVADGSPPMETSTLMLNVYVLSLGVSITLFTISLWCAVIVVRRLHEHTASILERKLFAQSEELGRIWQVQLKQNLPTGPYEMYLVNQAYDQWISDYIDPIGRTSIQLLSIGVVVMFVTAGLLLHNQYLIEYKTSISVPICFWSTVIITSATVLTMKYYEDVTEKKKEGVYDSSWKDQNLLSTGPFAKINKAAEELYSSTMVGLATVERMEAYSSREQMEREYCAKTTSLHHRVEGMRKEAERRSRMRGDVLALLTTAVEELDALPEELTSRLNKMLHETDDADRRTAALVSMRSENMNASEATKNALRRAPLRTAMAPHPIDAQRVPVSLASVRKKLGEISLTTLLRIKNLSDEPLRLKSGVHLKDGRYVKELNALDPYDKPACYQLYPGTEIPPRTELVIAARSNGAWVPTSGINGELVYTNRDGSWIFRIAFTNELIRNVRKFQVEASHLSRTGELSDEDAAIAADAAPDQYWHITKDELDRKSNNEISISIDVLRGEEANKAAIDNLQNQLALKSGFLLKNKAFVLNFQWQQKWFVLTPTEIVYEDVETKKTSKIAVKDITGVRPSFDVVRPNVFEIHTLEERAPYKLAAPSRAERDDWIKKISHAAGISPDLKAIKAQNSSITSLGESGNGEEIELIQSDSGTEVMPPV